MHTTSILISRMFRLVILIQKAACIYVLYWKEKCSRLFD